METRETGAEALTGDEAQVAAAAELSDDIGVEAHEADVAAELIDDIGVEAHETGDEALTGDEAQVDTAAELNEDLGVEAPETGAAPTGDCCNSGQCAMHVYVDSGRRGSP